MKYIIYLLLAAAVLGGCQKKDNTTPDADNVTMTITAPAEGHVYRVGDTIYLAATVSYVGELHGYELKITDTATGTVLYDKASHIHSDRFDISEAWAMTSTTALGLKLELITEVDHNGTEARKSVSFAYLP